MASKFFIVGEAMRDAREKRTPARTVQAWADQYGISRTYVYQIAEFNGFRDFFTTADRSESVVKISFHTCKSTIKQRTKKPMAIVPSTLLRYANLGDKGRLKMSVIEPGKILVEAATP